MDNGADSPSSAPLLNLVVIGLGPGGLDRVPPSTMAILSDPGRHVIARTMDHPAARELASLRPVTGCDDLYLEGEDFESVYHAIALRVVEAARSQPVVYVTPGSPLVGERAVGMIRSLAAQKGLKVTVCPAESFVDAALEELGIDPLDPGADGAQRPSAPLAASPARPDPGGCA